MKKFWKESFEILTLEKKYADNLSNDSTFCKNYGPDQGTCKISDFSGWVFLSKSW